MEQSSSSRWDLDIAISAAKRTSSLVNKYKSDFEPRIQDSELQEFEQNIVQLERHRIGQTENLTYQKMSTLTLGDCRSSLFDIVTSLRSVVKHSGASPALLKAFGYGEKISNKSGSLLSTCNVALKAYEENKQWCNTYAGIVDEDIIEMRQLMENLRQNTDEQSDAKENRKLGTISKNATQASVEASIVRFSTLGAHIFRRKDQRIAQLFSDLVPIYSKNKASDEKVEVPKEK